MKTSLEIADSLFRQIKRLAHKRGTTVRALTEEGLRMVLIEAEKKEAVQPKLLTFGGDGLTDEFRTRGLSWEVVRDEVYRGHGS